MRILRNKWFRIASSAALALLIVASTLFGLFLRVSIKSEKGIVSVGISQSIVLANPGISIRAVGVPSYGTSNLNPAIPAAQDTGDMMICFYGTKPYSDAPTIDQEWASLGYATDGTIAAGIDVGSMQARIFWKIATVATETNPTITNSTNNVSTAVIIVFQKTSSNWVTPVGAGGGDATTGTGFSITASSDVGNTTGDMVAGFACFRSDTATPTTARSITITGCGLGSYVQAPTTDPETTSGGDMGLSGGYIPVNSGTSSAAPVYNMTLGAAHTGSAYLVRLREAAEPSITVLPTTYDFGAVAESSAPSTTTSYFTIDNTSTIQTDQTISVTTTTWSGGVTWIHSDTATPGTNQAGMLANKGGTWGSGDVIVKYNATWNDIATNQAANADYSFGLKLIAPTAFTDGVQKAITVRITAAAG